MKFIKKILPCFIIVIVAVFLFLFKSVTTGHLWNGYTVLYVSDSVSDSIVKESLDYAKIPDYVSLSQQQTPIKIKENSPELTMMKIFLQSSEYSYMYKRLNYFYDQSREYRLYYIPEQYKSNLSSCSRYLEHRGITSGIDSETVYPWILPVVVLVIVAVLAVFSKTKILFLMSSCIPVEYVFTNPYFSSATAVVLLLLILFFLSNIWNRKNAIKNLLKNVLVIIIFAAAIVSSFAASLKSGFFYLSVLLAVSASIFLYIDIHNEIEHRKRFQFVFIRPGKMISIFAGKTNVVMPVLIGGIAVILLYFGLTFSGTVKVADSKIKLPGNSSVKADELPEIEDFCRWNWNVATAPYKNLNVNNTNPDIIRFPQYEEQENHTIVKKEFVLAYNDSYKSEIIENVSFLGFNSIEQVLLQQENFTGGYESSATVNISFFSIIMMFICFIVLLFIYFSAIIRKGGGKK